MFTFYFQATLKKPLSQQQTPSTAKTFGHFTV